MTIKCQRHSRLSACVVSWCATAYHVSAALEGFRGTCTMPLHALRALSSPTVFFFFSLWQTLDCNASMRSSATVLASLRAIQRARSPPHVFKSSGPIARVKSWNERAQTSWFYLGKKRWDSLLISCTRHVLDVKVTYQVFLYVHFRNANY